MNEVSKPPGRSTRTADPWHAPGAGESRAGALWAGAAANRPPGQWSGGPAAGAALADPTVGRWFALTGRATSAGGAGPVAGGQTVRNARVRLAGDRDISRWCGGANEVIL